MQETELARKLLDAMISMKRLFRRDTVGSLKHSEVGLLFMIKYGSPDDGEGIKISEISNRMHVTSPTITQLVTSLEEHGLVVRKMDQKDRRSVKVNLTEKGFIMAKEAEEDMLASFNVVVDHMGEERTMQMINLMNEMLDIVIKKGNEKNE